MSETIQYLFTQQDTPERAVVFRSTVNSYGLEHVTDKDLFSFYTQFSKSAFLDTGLLPVDGTGVLSIRSALNHTQVAYQHAPGKYYINWGATEGDPYAIKYLVAQPYRIVIIDFLDNNLLGARTFYSPYPVTHPNTQLYHVNLPNINCRGYRGNGVGWICLYHNEDLSQYPFNERLVKAIERCSGVEAYNDANMSETDGTRFYQEHRPNNRFLYDPKEWEKKTEQDGVDWTLDEDLWIPILVQDFDHQDKHYSDGQPLTFVDALFGNYQAYYYDKLRPKPVNAISRTDLELDYNQLFSSFKTAYMTSSTSFQKVNTFELSSQVKKKISETNFVPSFQEESEPEPEVEIMICPSCGYEESYDPDEEAHPESFTITVGGAILCGECFNDNYAEIPEVGFVPLNSPTFATFLKDFQAATHLCHHDHDQTIEDDCDYPVSFRHHHLNSSEDFEYLRVSYTADKNHQQYFKNGYLNFRFDIENVKAFLGLAATTEGFHGMSPYVKHIFNAYIAVGPELYAEDIVVNVHIMSMCGKCFTEMFNSDKTMPSAKFPEYNKFVENYLSMNEYLLDLMTNVYDETGDAIYRKETMQLVNSNDIMICFDTYAKSVF